MGQTENRLFFESAVTYTLFLYKSSKKLTSDCSACGHPSDCSACVTYIYYFCSVDVLWLGLHEPDPQNSFDVRAWSDCSGIKGSNWDPNNPPSTGLMDTSLCTVLDTSSMFWYTTQCNDKYAFVCTGKYSKCWFYISLIHSAKILSVYDHYTMPTIVACTCTGTHSSIIHSYSD